MAQEILHKQLDGTLVSHGFIYDPEFDEGVKPECGEGHDPLYGDAGMALNVATADRVCRFLQIEDNAALFGYYKMSDLYSCNIPNGTYFRDGHEFILREANVTGWTVSWRDEVDYNFVRQPALTDAITYAQGVLIRDFLHGGLTMQAFLGGTVSDAGEALRGAQLIAEFNNDEPDEQTAAAVYMAGWCDGLMITPEIHHEI